MNPSQNSPQTSRGEQTNYRHDASSQAAKQSSDNDQSAQKPARAHNPGRFDNDRERARIAGKKGGENPNNAGRFDNNRERARIAGKKGGESSQASRNATTNIQ